MLLRAFHALLPRRQSTHDPLPSTTACVLQGFMAQEAGHVQHVRRWQRVRMTFHGRILRMEAGLTLIVSMRRHSAVHGLLVLTVNVRKVTKEEDAELVLMDITEGYFRV